MLTLETLERRDCPATLDLTGGALSYTASIGTANNLTVSVSGGTYTFSDTGETITVTGDTAGWSGSGTNTVRGPDAGVSSISTDLGDGDDVLNVRSANDPLAALDGDGNDTANVCSNAPTNTGSLVINGTVTVNGGTGSDNLVVSDFSAATGNDSASIVGDTISGLAPADVIFSGDFALVRVVTSNTPVLAESVTINDPSAPVRLDTGAGADSVFVLANSRPLAVNTGAGNDSVTLGDGGSLTGILGAVTLDLGSGANSLALDDSAGGGHAVTVTNAQVTGFAPAAINYKALGGSLTLSLACGAHSTAHVGPHSTLTTIDLVGDWTEV